MPKRILQGKVVSVKNHKTVSVKIERTFMHPLYKKIVRKSAKYTAHDEQNSCQLGDKVKIQESKPISKTKCWLVIAD